MEVAVVLLMVVVVANISSSNNASIIIRITTIKMDQRIMWMGRRGARWQVGRGSVLTLTKARTTKLTCRYHHHSNIVSRIWRRLKVMVATYMARIKINCCSRTICNHRLCTLFKSSSSPRTATRLRKTLTQGTWVSQQRTSPEEERQVTQAWCGTSPRRLWGTRNRPRASSLTITSLRTMVVLIPSNRKWTPKTRLRLVAEIVATIKKKARRRSWDPLKSRNS